ncbi:hypothetical protein AOLI_G00225500 [Acnodon oligacanthus]
MLTFAIRARECPPPVHCLVRGEYSRVKPATNTRTQAQMLLFRIQKKEEEDLSEIKRHNGERATIKLSRRLGQMGPCR